MTNGAHWSAGPTGPHAPAVSATAADASELSISVVIPTHERPSYLAIALDSVLAQSRPPREVIVVDDACEDAARRVVERAAERCASGPALRYLSNTDAPGVSGSRNLGAAHATGDILALLDDDDSWEPGYLDAVRQRFSETDADVVLTWRYEDRGRWTVPCERVPEGLEAADVLSVNPGAVGSNLCIRRTVFDAVDGFDERLLFTEDKDLFYRVLRGEGQYAVVTQRLVRMGNPPGERATQGTARQLQGMRSYYYKHYGRCLRRDHRELKRVIRRAELRIGRSQETSVVRRYGYTVPLLLSARPRKWPTKRQLRSMLLPQHE